MPRDLIKKRKVDQLYRDKKKDNLEFKLKRREASKRAYQKKISSLSSRDRRQINKGRRMQRRENKIAQRESVEMHDENSEVDQQEANETTSTKTNTPSIVETPKSKAARQREKLKIKTKCKKMVKQIEQLMKENQRLKKRQQRMNKIPSERKRSYLPQSSPNKFVTATLASPKQTETVLSMHHMLLKALKTSAKRKAMTDVVNKICLKYRGGKKHFKKIVKLDSRTITKAISEPKRPLKPESQKIEDFLCRDDNSRMTSGKAETKTKGGKKEQIRYLYFAYEVLYQKFLLEATSKIGRSSFYSHAKKVFYVRQPKINNREQCLCISCENVQFLVDSCYLNNVVATRDKSSLVSKIVCDQENVECMLRQCNLCKTKMAHDSSKVKACILRYYQWEKVKTEEGFVQTKNVEKRDSMVGVVTLMEKELNKYASHMFRAFNQYKAIRKAKDELKSNEILLHVDFSENYTGCQTKEVQSSHFGYHHQIVIHQGILYKKDEQPQAFVTLSNDKRKTAESIVAHLSSIIDEIDDTLQSIVCVSDSPSSQYRNKFTINLFRDMLNSKNIQDFRWIFTESGHGKGAPDGVGAAVKRQCDQHVARGNSIQCAEDVLNLLHSNQDTTILSKLVNSQEIDTFQNRRSEITITEMKGIMECHEITCNTKYASYHHSKLSNQQNEEKWYTIEHNAEQETDADSSEESLSFAIGDWVVVRYNGSQYPGKVCSITEGNVEVTCMEATPTGSKYQTNYYRWPARQDILLYSTNEIVRIIEPPQERNRGQFYFQEL